MKKLVMWTIFSSWLIHIGVPLLYKIFSGKYPQHIQHLGAVSEEISTKIVLILTAVYFISLLIINFFVSKNKDDLVSKEKGNISYFYINLLISGIILVTFSNGDYAGVLAGNLNGRFFAYYSMFFGTFPLFIMYLYCIETKKNIFVFIGAYLIFTVLSFSRQGSLVIVLNLCGYLLCEKKTSICVFENKKHGIRADKRKLRFIIIVLCLTAPAFFLFASNKRGTISKSASHSLVETIAARCSCLETSGYALEKYDVDNYDRELFLKKYGVKNQTLCIIDSMFPGSFFSDDVDPNQYFRYIFGYMSYDDARNYYSSTNFMLPIYCIVKYGYILGFCLSIILIVVISSAILRIKNDYIKVCVMCVVLKNILYYFDWVMIWRDILVVVLTVFMHWLLTKKVKLTKSFLALSM